MFSAEKGSGAYLNNSRIRVWNKKGIKNALIVTGGPKGSSKIKKRIARINDEGVCIERNDRKQKKGNINQITLFWLLIAISKVIMDIKENI